jgi:Fe-S cluster assembly ATP-binding protein
LADGQVLLDGVNLEIKTGETHVLIGTNGAGKSTLANVIMGSPKYSMKSGEIWFEGTDISDEKTHQRARRGIFLSFQAPEEIDGITLRDFLRTAKSTILNRPVPLGVFCGELEKTMKLLGMDRSYANRYLNMGFSGGEKKKSEILQMLTLDPKLAILDETDSGLDIDAIKTVANGIKHYKNENNALLIISHSTKLLEKLDIDYVHIMLNGRIVHTGGKELILEIHNQGFEAFLPRGAKNHEK